MSIIKRENWFIYLILNICTLGMFNVAIAVSANLLDKNAWYLDKRYWIGAIICFIFPVFAMFLVFSVQMMCKVANKLEVPGKELYNTPYFWIICIIVPLIGWAILIATYIYLLIWMSLEIKRGNGEKLIK